MGRLFFPRFSRRYNKISIYWCFAVNLLLLIIAVCLFPESFSASIFNLNVSLFKEKLKPQALSQPSASFCLKTLPRIPFGPGAEPLIYGVYSYLAAGELRGTIKRRIILVINFKLRETPSGFFTLTCASSEAWSQGLVPVYAVCLPLVS